MTEDVSPCCRSSSKEEDDSEGAQQGQPHREDAAVDKPSGSFGEGASQGDQGSEGAWRQGQAGAETREWRLVQALSKPGAVIVV